MPAAHAARQELTYYAAVDGLTVYAEASDSSKVVGHLALYERVERTRLEHGYAYVSAGKSGVKGWVDNAKLVWRVPAKEHPTEAEQLPTPTVTGIPETQEATPQAVPPTPPPTRAAVEPAIYEPF